jgi:K(+)-stimulated pyrophosphate-energized sodium pump
MAIIGLIFMSVKRTWVLKQDPGDGKMKEISDYIYEGALAFLKAEYRLLTFFVIAASFVLAAIILYLELQRLFIVVAFVIGAFFSALAGNMGMRITKTNVRTTQAARTVCRKHWFLFLVEEPLWDLCVAGLGLGLTSFFISFTIFYEWCLDY